jgi:hypothetical protein
MNCRFKQGLFDRWFIVHPQIDELMWSGSRWVETDAEGLPLGGVHVCNFATEQEAAEYARQHGLTGKSLTT